MNDELNVIILAGGEGKRMNTAHQKSMMELCGLPMLEWTLRAVEALASKRVTVVTGYDAKSVEERYGHHCRCVCESEPGETNAALCAMKELSGRILVIKSSFPLMTATSIKTLCCAGEKGAAVLMSPCNKETAAVLADKQTLCSLTSVGELDCWADELVNVHSAVCVTLMQDECAAVTDRMSLAKCTRALQNRICALHMSAGVTIIDPDSVSIDADVRIGRDTVIRRGAELLGSSIIGENTVIHSGCRLTDSTVGSGCILQNVVANKAYVGDNVTIGPFVNLRPDTHIASGCKIGDFVEIKNSNIGDRTKVPHLTYVGDADVGARVNVGCGCVFVNYDGFHKFRTVVGDDVFLGCQTNLVAPVTVENDAYTAAGTTVTEDVPAYALAVARPHQKNIDGWVNKYRAMKKKDK